MTLKEIFNSKKSENYLMSHFNGEFHTDFIYKRKINSVISKEDTPFIFELLNDMNKKWFVASYLQTVSSFDSDLLKKIIEVGINTSDPSYNNFFICPCVRIFGCIKVIELLENSLDTNPKYADGILSAVYHVRSLISSIGKIDTKEEVKWKKVGFEYKWNSTAGKYESYSREENRKMTNDELNEYEPTRKEFMKRKKALILNIKEKTNDSNLIESANRMLEQI